MAYKLSKFCVKVNSHNRAMVRTVIVPKERLAVRIACYMRIHGLILKYRVIHERIIIYFKFEDSRPVFREIVPMSKPGRRVFWDGKELAAEMEKVGFSGFYIVSTFCGVVSTWDTGAYLKRGGEILAKIVI